MATSGRVIRIFDEYTVAINVGKFKGVQRGMEFGIYTPLEDIVDPETQVSLGKIRHRKAIVEASSVFDQFTICRTPTRYRSPRLGIPSLTGDPQPIQDPLPVQSSQLKPYEGGTSVRVGDTVEEIEKAKS